MNASAPWIILFSPLIAAALITVVTQPFRKASSYLSVAAVAISFLASLTVFAGPHREGSINWIDLGVFQVRLGYLIDELSKMMLLVVTGVGLLIHIYSIGYMKDERGRSRYFAALSLFMFSMLGIVLANNFIMMFIFWELVGVSSYILISHWFTRASAADAGNNAFIVNRLGDFGFIIGIMMVCSASGTVMFEELGPKWSTLGLNPIYINAAMILVFCGAVGKSAQFPLHVWLPDAMEGPTPVSALIHAATMVAAGVYLVARLFPIYAAAAGPQSLMVVGFVGGFTALFAATIALVQNDIKRVLAYSTISQLGYMFVGLAVADTNTVGMFHLYTHAFFKALLFLGSGSVIHAVANQDMRKMGGLAKRMPITAITFLLATLSIVGFPGFAGFFSKDLIISTAFDYGAAGHVEGYILYGLTLFTAFLTAFYMLRLYYLTFGGRGASWLGLRGGDEQFRGEQRAHESPWTMTVPLLVLAVPAVLAGYWFGFFTFVNNGATVSFVNPLQVGKTYIGVAAGLLGILLAGLMYGTRRVVISPQWYTHVPGGAAVYTLASRKYYLDELYAWLIRTFILGISSVFVWFDLHVIDGFVNGSASFVRGVGRITSRSETGQGQNYAAAIFGGAVIIAIALFLAVAYPLLNGK